MGQYKVPQDVEAEDKLIGPLSLRQFIYIIIALAWGGLMWRILGFNVIIMILAILPVSGFFILLGVGRRQEQSFENYFVAMVRFAIVPRIRSWQKDISHDMIVKYEPKKAEVVIDKNIPSGSLRHLAFIMDTHGTQKDPTIQLQDANNQAMIYSQRVIDPSQVAQTDTAGVPVRATRRDDMLDENGVRSNQVNELLENVEADIHQQALDNIRKNLNTEQVVSSQPQQASQPQTSDAILKKAMLQGNNLTVEQLAKQAGQQVLPEGQQVSVSLNQG